MSNKSVPHALFDPWTYFLFLPGPTPISLSHLPLSSGKFLERGRILKPDPVRGSAAVVYYGLEDMVTGNQLNINCHKFDIIQVDEFSRKVRPSGHLSQTRTNTREHVQTRVRNKEEGLRG